MTILNTYIISPLPVWVGWVLAGAGMFLFLLSILLRTDTSILPAFGAALVVSGALWLSRAYTDMPVKKVEATIDSTVTFREINERYLLTSQSGDIFTFTDKDWSPGDEL